MQLSNMPAFQMSSRPPWQRDPYYESPPRTPPRNPQYLATNNNGHLGTRSSFPETFLEDLTPVEGPQHDDSGEDERDPHDLSLSPQHGARTSIVDNMLLSLDQFSEAHFNVANDPYPSQEPDPFTLYSRYATAKFNRHRGHTFSSSFSSDVEDSGGRYSSPIGRGRRSNSSSNFPSMMRRAEAMDGGTEKVLSSRNKAFESQRAVLGSQSARFVGNGSRGSDSSGVDIAQMLVGSRSGKPRRSISFDYGTDGPPVMLMDDDMLRYDDLNAAPTPTVPAGPRRSDSPALKEYPSLQHGMNAKPPALSRKNSAKSARSQYIRKGRSDTLGTATIRGRPDDGRYLRDSRPDVPPMPSRDHIPAPSPSIALHKPIQFPPAVDTSAPPASKERYGFLRRVFGSSKSSSPTQSERTQSFGRDNETSGRPRESQSAPNSSKGYPPQGQQNAARTNPPVVTKKPSSFFRRRKKSTTDSVPPPLIIPASNLKPDHASGDIGAEPSLESSLRQFMKPYISGYASSSHDGSRPATESETREDGAGIESTSRVSAGKIANVDTRGVSKRTYTNDSPLSSHNTTIRKVNAGLDPSFARRDGDDSFLADSSGNEAPTLHNSEDLSKRPKTSPVPQTSLRNSILSGNGERHTSRVGARIDNKLSINTSIQLRERPRRESASSTDGKDDSSKRAVFSDKTSQSPPVSAATTVSQYQTAFNTPLMSPAEDSSSKLKKITSTSPIEESVDESKAQESEASPGLNASPSVDDRQRAQQLYDDTEEERAKDERSAAWLGHPDRAAVRKAYMDMFDWSDMNILAAMRSLCSKMTLRGETQQVDRVLDAFSSRWCECNPNHGFKATDVVHTICYSILLLNTDLHVADIEQKMTRAQFIRNTMPTIQRVVLAAAPDSFENINTSSKLRPRSTVETPSERTSTPIHDRNEFDAETAYNSLPKPQDLTPRANSVTNVPAISNNDPSGHLVNAPFRGTKRAWESQVETVLKEFYNSIQKRRLPLRGFQDEPEEHTSSNFLTLTGNMLRRTPSTISRATASDIFPRGRTAENRLSTARWASKPRSRARMYPSSMMTSSRTSLDDQSTMWSPAASSTWSKASLGKTLTSMSVDSLGSGYPRGDYQQSIGFANALSHAIIREDSASGVEDLTRPESLLEDEALELAGAPWAKEGNMQHKHHLDSVDKRAKDRNWNETFAVIQRGWMRLFSFNNASKSMRIKPKQKIGGGGGGIVVGGGNWMENADETWKFLLRHTIASALPQPGYSKTRPYVWALSLPTGAVHLFQVGTPEIVKEFVSTANYWSARLSKEPMFGGISNIEYGWSDAVVNLALAQPEPVKPTSSSGTRLSIQSSIRSSLDQQTVRPRLPADRIHISDWTPPQQSMIASALPEAEQLAALRNYVRYVEEELQRHNELRPAMTLAFTPRHPNATKALANWERKSSYLLREIVKFRTYIDCLQTAQVLKEKFYSTLSPGGLESRPA